MSVALLVLAAPAEGPARLLVALRRRRDGSLALLADPDATGAGTSPLPPSAAEAAGMILEPAEMGMRLGHLEGLRQMLGAADCVDLVAHLEPLPPPGAPRPPDRRVDLWLLGPGTPALPEPLAAPAGGAYRFEARRLEPRASRQEVLLLPGTDADPLPAAVPLGPLGSQVAGEVRGLTEAVLECLAGASRRGGALEAWLEAPQEEGGAGVAAEHLAGALDAARELLVKALAGEGAGRRTTEAGEFELELGRAGQALEIAWTLEGGVSRHALAVARFEGAGLGAHLDPTAAPFVLTFESVADLGWALGSARDVRVYALERALAVVDAELAALDAESVP